jgi:hypothetical protein
MLYKLVLVIAIASCLLMPVIAFARGGHGGGGRAHGGNYKSNYNIGLVELVDADCRRSQSPVLAQRGLDIIALNGLGLR